MQLILRMLLVCSMRFTLIVKTALLTSMIHVKFRTFIIEKSTTLVTASAMTSASATSTCSIFGNGCRLLCRYKNWPQGIYVLLMCLPAVLYGLACCSVGYQHMTYEYKVYLCMPPTAFAGPSLDFFVGTNMIICLAVVVVYATAYVVARKMGDVCLRRRWRDVTPKAKSDDSGFGGAASSQGERFRILGKR